MTSTEILKRLKSLENPKAVKEMAHFAITATKAYGISIPVLRSIAKEIEKDQRLSLELWDSGILEARVLAALIGEPKKVTERQMEAWVKEFDSWAICDCCCSVLFDKTPFAYRKAMEWCKKKEEFVKRAGYVMMAVLAVHDKKADDVQFIKMFPAIKRGATDDRNFVKKAVNWALRQIGKRNKSLNTLAIKLGKEIKKMDSPAAKWIAADALRELRGAGVQKRLMARK
ncbi:MAG: DNA alkylation repair protein [Ignavibacteriales bacterium]|nr:DNA alkylation repair protein [Ignavibacteriales bacterium]